MRLNGKAPREHKRKYAKEADSIIQNIATKDPEVIFAHINSKVADVELRKILKAIFLLALDK